VTGINYTIKNDIIFKYLFSDTEILKSFLETVLERDIFDIEITNQFNLDKIRYDDKVGILDIKARVCGKDIIDIEMQRREQPHYIQRILLYTGKIEASQLKVSDEYSKIQNVISISILDFVLFPNIDKVHTIWNLREKDNTDCSLKELEYHFLELPKFRKSNPDLEEKINQWLTLIDTENKEWLEVVMENNDNVKKAVNKVDDFVADDETRILIDLREKWQLDYNTDIAYAKKSGLQQGIEQGSKENKIKIAKKLLEKNYNINDIIEITELTKDEINNLK
jgi:predicted transposase/invertase (TIGR01784 family)